MIPPSNARPLHRAALLLVAVILAAGCGASGSPDTPTAVRAGQPSATSGTRNAPSTTEPDPDDGETSSTDATADATADAAPAACSLLTEADAAESFGEPALAGTQSRDECWWSSKNDLKTVNLIRRTGDIEEWRAGYQNSYWTRIDMGDEGYAGKALDSIVFRLGETTYEINVVYSTSDGDPGEVVGALAAAVVSRL